MSNQEQDENIRTYAINPFKIGIVLVGGVVTLLLLSAVVRFSSVPVFDALGLKRFLNVNAEGNLPTTFSGALLLTAAGLLFIATAVRPSQSTRFQRHWLGLGIIFTGLSIDELAGVHELFNSVGLLLEKLGWDAMFQGAFRWPWVVAGMVFVLAISIVYFRFLRALPIRTQVLFVGAAILFVSGAVAMEMVGAVLADRAEQAARRPFNLEVAIHIEEGLEMLGVVLFIYALLDYLKPITVSINRDRRSVLLSSGDQDGSVQRSPVSSI